MGTVTIAATYGAGGSVIAPALATRLGLTFIERAIPVSLAERIHKPLEAALADDADDSTALGRLLNSLLGTSGLFVGVPQAPEALGAIPDIAQTEAALRRLADSGGAVILGRAGVFVLQGRPDVLHVRLDGDVEARRRAAVDREGIDYATAARTQERTDRARSAYVRHFYPRAGAWEDARHYHVVLDSTAIPFDTCLDIIVRAAKDLFGASTTASGRV
jgi:cytidylate kinase